MAEVAPTVRLFAGVWPPDEVVEQLASLPRPEMPGIRWTAPAQWHVTLAFLGDVGAPAVETLGSILVHSVARLPGPFEARLGSVMRLGASVLCVPVTGLDALAASLRSAFAAVQGADADRMAFRGHLTLARARRRQRMPSSLAGTPIAAHWTVGAVGLVRSELHPEGSRYTTLVQATIPP